MKKIFRAIARLLQNGLLGAAAQSNKEQKAEKRFPTIDEQLSTQDPEGTMFYFTPDGGFHSVEPRR